MTSAASGPHRPHPFDINRAKGARRYYSNALLRRTSARRLIRSPPFLAGRNNQYDGIQLDEDHLEPIW